MRHLPAVFTLLISIVLMPFPVIAAPDPVFDVAALQSTPLNARVLKTTEKDGITTQEVMFHSEMDGDKSVDIFAFFSYPAEAKKLPAFIWNQAGLGRASTYWTEFGAKRGYAALCIDFPLPGYRSSGGYPINAGLEVGDDPLRAPIYHGAVALLKAVSYLQSRPEVDAERIGMAGSSWGGFFTTLMAGIDSRLKAASAMFGTGSLHLGNAWWSSARRSTPPDAAMIERWRTTLDPAWRLPQSKVPIAWFTGTNDSFYHLPAVTQTYEMAKAPKHLSLLSNWDHGLTPALDEQVFAWLDVHLKGAPEFIRVSPLRLLRHGNDLLAQWEYSGPREVASAELILSYGEGNWPRRAWSTLPVGFKNGVCSVALPPSPLPMYISGTVVDKDGFRYSTPLLKVSENFPGDKRDEMIEYNGAALWSSFEEKEIQFLKGLGWPAPQTSTDARSGKQAVLLPAGKTTLAPMLYTAGVPHRFTVYVKAGKPVTFTLEVGGKFGAELKTVTQESTADTNWEAITLEFQAPQESGDLQAIFHVPEGATLLLDDLSFVPLWDKLSHNPTR